MKYYPPWELSRKGWLWKNGWCQYCGAKHKKLIIPYVGVFIWK